jgi:hypothetical protein
MGFSSAVLGARAHQLRRLGPDDYRSLTDRLVNLHAEARGHTLPGVEAFDRPAASSERTPRIHSRSVIATLEVLLVSTCCFRLRLWSSIGPTDP